MSEWAEWVEILWGFLKFLFKPMLKVSVFYLEKQKSFIPKKPHNLGRSLYIGQESSNRWRFAVPIFREGFAWHILTFLISTTNKRECQKCSSKDLQASNWHLKMCTLSKKIPHNFNNNELQKTNLQSLGQLLDELQIVLNYWTE